MPPRGRKKRDDKLPAHIRPKADQLPDYVYFDPRGRGRWTCKTYDDATGKTKELALNLAASATLQQIWDAHGQLHSINRDCFRWLSDQFQKSTIFEKLADSLGSEVKPQEMSFMDRLRDFFDG